MLGGIKHGSRASELRGLTRPLNVIRLVPANGAFDVVEDDSPLGVRPIRKARMIYMVESTQTAPSGLLRWRVVDVTVTAVIAVASGVVFWGLGMVTVPLSTLMQVVPGLQALTWGLFYFAGPLAALVVRKPGAAIFAELIAALVEAVLGSHWGGLGTIIPGLVQGLGAEIAFAIVAYKIWNVGVATLSGAMAGLAGMIISWIMYYQGYGMDFIVIGFVCSVISGAVFAGALMWALYKAIAATGALGHFASGRDTRR